MLLEKINQVNDIKQLNKKELEAAGAGDPEIS